MNLKITLIALMLGTAGLASAQTSSEKYVTKAEMSEQMGYIVNGLGLQPAQIQQLGNIMEEKRLQKEGLLEQLDKIKQQLKDVELNSEKKIQGMLTAEEWAKYQKDIKPQLDADLEKRMKKIED